MGRADYYKHGDHNAICDYCGFKYKFSELRQTWDGYWACSLDWNVRQPQDYVKGVMDNMSVDVVRADPPDVFTEQAQNMVVWGSESLAVPDFSATPLTGSAPLAITFTNETTGTVSSYLWAFGDSENSTETNPTHVYANAGTYNVSLTATNSAGGASETKTAYITVT